MALDPPHLPDDPDAPLYRGVQRTLVGGMILSFGLLGLGLAGLLLDPGAAAAAAQVVPLDRLPAALLAAQPGALLDAGVLTLLCIPVVHLAVALATFIRRGETRYALAAGLVLVLLTAGGALAFLRPS